MNDTYNLCDLPHDIVKNIIKSIANRESLMNFRETCKPIYDKITDSEIEKKISFNFNNRDLCINSDCYEDTFEVFKEIHHYSDRRYVHKKQKALNTSIIIINNKKFTIKSHYCCECFKKYVLIGDRKNVEEIYHNNLCDEVNIQFN
jgi:hypothetical protein